MLHSPHAHPSLLPQHRTENPCPTKEQILDAWEKAKNSNVDLIRFGSLMEDLACYVDSSLIRTEDGAIVGRRGGVKAWLQANIPALYLKYKTVMAYKAAAKKLRQITELPEPLAVALLDRIDAYVDPEQVEEATTLADWRKRYRLEITVRTKSKWLKRLWKRAG